MGGNVHFSAPLGKWGVGGSSGIGGMGGGGGNKSMCYGEMKAELLNE